MKKRLLLILLGVASLVGLLGLIFLQGLKTSPRDLIIKGENIHSLDSPMGAATDDKYVYIANGNKNHIAVFNLKGEFQFPIGSIGQNDGELQLPVDVEVYKDKVYVADLGNNRVQIYSKSGQFLDFFPREQNIKPAALLIKNNQIYVSDIYSHSIKVFSMTGELLQDFAENGTNKGQLNYANGIAVSDRGDIIVADSQNQRVQLFSQNGSFKELIKTEMQLGLPKGISVSENDIYLADSLNKKIYVFNLEGNLLKEIKTKIALEFPTDVSLTKDYMVITDNGSNQVIVMKRAGE